MVNYWVENEIDGSVPMTKVAKTDRQTTPPILHVTFSLMFHFNKAVKKRRPIVGLLYAWSQFPCHALPSYSDRLELVSFFFLTFKIYLFKK